VVGDSASEAVSRDDAGLISAIASGDAAAYAQLHERHVAAARSLAGLVAEPGQAEEVLSDAFVRLHAVLRDGGGPEAAVRPYLLTEVRRAAGQDTDSAANPGAASAGAANPGAASPGAASPEAELAGSLLARAFAALPERQRAALWHAVIEQADPAQTAAILGVPAGGVAELAATASSAYIRSYLKLYESGHDREDCRDVVRGLDHGADGTLSGLDEFAALPHLRACRECRAAAIELADLGRSLRGWVAPVYLGVAATPGYLAWARVKVTKQAPSAGLVGGRRRRTGVAARRTGERPRRASHAPRPAAPAPTQHEPPTALAPTPTQHEPPTALAPTPMEHAPPTAPTPAEPALLPTAPPPATAHARRRPGQARGRLRHATRQQRVLAAGGLVVAAFAATGLALTLASSNGPAPPPAQRPAAIAPPSPAPASPSSAPARRRVRPVARPGPSRSPSPAPSPSAVPSPTPSPVSPTPPPGPIQDPFPPPRHHHHH
jgi:DNA-directed RNA polymerase specialized sigma24 family protein